MSGIKKNQNTSSTAVKALKVLETIAASEQPISMAEIVNQVHFDQSTVYRMLNTLMETEYIIRDDVTKLFSMSFKVLTLSQNLFSEQEMFLMIQDAVKHLSSLTGETVHVSALEGDEMVCVYQIKGLHQLNVDFRVGSRLQLHNTAVGKVILAFQDVRFVEKILNKDLPKAAKKTITDPDKLRKSLQKIRAEGYAIDDREFTDDIRCISVPIFEGNGQVSKGITVAGPAARLPLKKIQEIKQPLIDIGRELSKKMGGTSWNT